MTVLSAIQRASSEMGIARPVSVFSASDRTSQEVQDVANEVAQRIANAHDWQALKQQQAYTGNGETEIFPLPPGYGRMPKDQRLWSTRFDAPLVHVESSDEWLGITTRDYAVATGAWHMVGANIAFYPALASGETVRLYFLTNKIIEDDAGTGKEAFTADTDVFRLPDRLLRLGIILHWRMKRGFPAAPEPFGMALAEEIARDGGAAVIRVGRARLPAGVRVAYPQSIPH